jgi:hypothetical protein
MILPQLQEALVVASDRMVARRRRRTQRFRLGLMTSAAVVTLGGGAVASQPLWAPLLGWEDGNRASVSDAPAPAAQGALLGILRREQSAGDRGPAARAAVKAMSRRYTGVKVSSVRVVPDGHGAFSVLVPVSSVRGRTGGVTRGTGDDLLCLQIIFGGTTDQRATDHGSQRCFSAADIRGGGAVLPAGMTIRGVVPDGVSRVRFSGGSGPPREVPVTTNVFAASLLAVSGATSLSWLDRDGRPVVFDHGATSRPVAVPVVTPTLPPSVHDCGKALGGVVPRTIPCGPRSRRYLPEIGTPTYRSQKP